MVKKINLYHDIKHKQCFYCFGIKRKLDFYNIMQHALWFALVATWIQLHSTTTQLVARPPKHVAEVAHFWTMYLPSTLLIENVEYI